MNLHYLVCVEKKKTELLKIKIHIFLGGTELTDSRFHNCPNTHPYSRRVPLWVWIAISVGSAVLILILGIIVIFIRKSRSSAGLKKKSLPEPRQPAEKGNNNSLLIHDFSPF